MGLGDVGHGIEAQVARTRRVVFDEVQAKVFAVDKLGIFDPLVAVRVRTRAAVAVHLLLQRAQPRSLSCTICSCERCVPVTLCRMIACLSRSQDDAIASAASAPRKTMRGSGGNVRAVMIMLASASRSRRPISGARSALTLAWGGSVWSTRMRRVGGRGGRSMTNHAEAVPRSQCCFLCCAM
jgi:hypothetical protein